MLCHCVNLKAIRYESTSLNRIAADKSHRVIVALEINNVCNTVEGHCLKTIKIVRHHANGRFDWLISGHQSVNLLRETVSILSVKYERFTFVYPVINSWILKSVQSTLSHLISTSVPPATFTRFFVERGLFQYYLY